MGARTIYTETLEFAAQALGGPQRLAAALGVERARLAEWLAGAEPPPLEVFVGALELIAAAPYRAGTADVG